MTSTPLPEPLVSGIGRALAAIDQDGELPAVARATLHRAVDALGQDIHPEAARYVRAKLALTCATQSLTHLREHPRLHESAEALLRHVAATMRGDLDVDDLEAEYDDAHAQAVELLQSGAVEPAVGYALLSCAAAASTVVYDTDLDGLGVGEIRADPADWEACFFASLAACGGATWEGVGTRDARRHYWEWYLGTAVPHAWDPETPLLPLAATPDRG
jgi:hypothetical protein